jgi:hypothetical protein
MVGHRLLPAWVPRVVLAAVAAALAVAGAVPMVDHVTHRVLSLAESVPWSEWSAPLWMPAPIQSWSLRPGAVLITKLFAAALGTRTPPPVALTAATAFLSLWLFGSGARAWLRAHGFGRLSLPAAVASMLTAPALFSAWYLPEYDALGAGLALFGVACFTPRRSSLARRVVGGVALVAALTLKESSALVVFALLAADAWVRWVRQDRDGALRSGLMLAALLGVFLVLAAPLLVAEGSLQARTPLRTRLAIIELDIHQYLYLVGTTGAVAVAIGGLGAWAARSLRWSPLLACVGLLLVPPLGFYSHYEAVFFAPRALATGIGVLLFVGLIGLATRPAPERSTRHAAAALLAVYGAMTLAALIASSAREDVASRVMLASAPLLYALAFSGLTRALGHVPTGWNPRRVAVWALAAGVALYPVASAVDFTLDWRARHRVDAAGRVQLAQEPVVGGIVAFNHYVLWVGPEELQAVGGAAALADQTVFVQVAAWQPRPAFPRVSWGRGVYDLERAWRVGVPLELYWLAARSDMSPRANELLDADLSWTRRNMGLFTPIGLSAPSARPVALARHNLPEDMNWTQYRAGPSPLESLATERGSAVWALDAPFVQVPRNLFSIPYRLIEGVPVVERYHYEGRLVRIASPPGVPRRPPEAGRVEQGVPVPLPDPVAPPGPVASGAGG